MKSVVRNVFRGLFVFAVTCLVAQTAFADIAFDSNSATFSNTANPTISWSHTIGGGQNRILIVGLGAEDTLEADLVISSVKYNGIDMTLVAGSSSLGGTSSTRRKTELYYTLNANLPSAGTYTVTVTYAGSVSNKNAGAISLTGAAQQAREAVAINSNIDQNNISTNITTLTSGAWVVDAIVSGNAGSFTATGTSMTERWDVSANSSSAAGCTRPVPTAGLVTISWQHSTGASGNRIAHSVAAFAPSEITNLAPSVDAGTEQHIAWPVSTVQLNATITDDGLPNPPGAVSKTWSKVSGPGTVSFLPNASVEDPCASFSTYGDYVLRIDVNDGQFTASDEVDIFVHEPVQPVQHPAGDLNQDWEVDWEDANIFMEQWLDAGCSGPACADIDGQNGVNFDDFALLAANWSLAFPHPRTGLVINEVMASNDSNIADEHGQYDDWIEIFNNSSQPIDIGGMYITDDLNEPNKWQIPTGYSVQTTIPAYGYLLLWADNDVQDGPLHLSFQLSAGGEAVGLYAADGNLIDSMEFGEQATDVSWGPYPDASSNMRYMGIATPRARNNDGYIGELAEVDTSHVHGFYDANFVAELFCKNAGATIKYTLNGDEPNDSIGLVYNPNTRINITTTTCLRAAAFKSGWKSSVVNTATYIFLNDVKTQSTANAQARGFPWPNWINRSGGTTPADYEMDGDVLNDPAYGPQFSSAMKAIPTVSLVTGIANLFNPQKGIYANADAIHQEGNPNWNWERPASIEYFDPCTGQDFQINCGLRITGNQSRWTLNPKHSFRALFTSEYGPGKLEFPLFENTTVTSHKTFCLRSQYHISWVQGDSAAQFTRDMFAQDSVRDMGYLSPDSRFVHLYINGLYWGLFQATERPDDAFMAEHLGGQPDDYEVVEGIIGGSDGVEYKGDVGDQTWHYIWTLITSHNYSNPLDATEYQEVERYIDTSQMVDYIIYMTWAVNWDWCTKNWYAASLRGGPTGPPTGKWQFYPWDSEITLQWYSQMHGIPFAGYYDGGPGKMHNAMHQNPVYNRLFGDRVRKLCENNGVLTTQPSVARYQKRASQIEKAVVGESARWGDYVHDQIDANKPLYTLNGHWTPQRNWLVSSFFSGKSSYIIGAYRGYGLYPSASYPAPVFSQHGGEIAAGSGVTITGSGTIKYTTDGREPIDYGNTIASGGTVTINNSLTLKARADFGSGNWSALNEATFAVGPIVDKLRITEIMYHPIDPCDPNDPNEEFVELKNIGTSALNLNLVKFTEGIHFTFPNMTLAASDYVLVVQDANDFNDHYGGGKNVAGTYTGALANNGERIKLEDAIGRTVLDFKYADNWIPVTDDCFSLNFFDADANSEPNRWKDASNWCASKYTGGTPDVADTGLLKERSIAINEILAHSDVAPGDWIELKNTTAGAIDIGGWYLSDSDETEADLKKYQIRAGTILNADAYLVLSEDANFGTVAPDPCRLVGFALSELGETLYLTSAVNGVLTGYREKEDFDASEREVPFGRYLKSTGTYNFVAMSSKTPGAANSYPKVGPVVINEIHYNPAGGAQNLEYIELLNITGSAVNLYDVNNVPWLFTDGIDYEFPVGTTIPANGYLLVVNTTPAYFRALYPSVPVGVTVLGPYDGKLSNAGEKLDLSMPGDVELGYQYYIRVDRVVYSDGSHPEDCPEGVDLWPTAADGGGKSLSRITPANYGNDPDNWEAGNPSPGAINP